MGQRSYRQDCLLAEALDQIGERWTLLLIRELLIRPRRYTDLSLALKGMGTNLLATRLKTLEASGLLRRTRTTQGRTYVLTERGLALQPALLELIRWRFAQRREKSTGCYHHSDWDLLSLKALYQPARIVSLNLSARFHLPLPQTETETETETGSSSTTMAANIEQVDVWLSPTGMRWDFDRHHQGRVDLHIDGSISTLFETAATGARIVDNRIGSLAYRGDRGLLARFINCFGI